MHSDTEHGRPGIAADDHVHSCGLLKSLVVINKLDKAISHIVYS